MLKMPEDMTPEELEKFEKWMFEADEVCERRKKESAWREDSFEVSMFRIQR